MTHPRNARAEPIGRTLRADDQNIKVDMFRTPVRYAHRPRPKYSRSAVRADEICLICYDWWCVRFWCSTRRLTDVMPDHLPHRRLQSAKPSHASGEGRKWRGCPIFRWPVSRKPLPRELPRGCPTGRRCRLFSLTPTGHARKAMGAVPVERHRGKPGTERRALDHAPQPCHPSRIGNGVAQVAPLFFSGFTPCTRGRERTATHSNAQQRTATHSNAQQRISMGNGG
jgi:hypothetical protein